MTESEPVVEILDPGREIIDPHHHLWPTGDAIAYDIDELAADTGSGHNIVGTVFVECSAAYHSDGPEHLRSVGETAFVAEAAAKLEARASPDRPGPAPILGIVANVDLANPAAAEAIDANIEAGSGLFRGVRDALARSDEPEAMMIPGRSQPGKATDPAFQAGVRALGERGHTYDSWHYHYQTDEFLALARAVPGTTLVLDHFSTPVGVGRYAGRQDETFAAWRLDMTELAACENVVAKLGGLAMPDNGFEWSFDNPATAESLADVQGRWYHHMIETFGAERCMFESNFPVDKLSVSYPVLWNGFKLIASRYSDAEQDALFSGTARRVYRL